MVQESATQYLRAKIIAGISLIVKDANRVIDLQLSIEALTLMTFRMLHISWVVLFKFKNVICPLSAMNPARLLVAAVLSH